MPLILKPSIIVDEIKIEADANSDSVERVINEFRNTPLIKIGEYVLGLGDLIDFSFKIRLNSLPTFSMTVNDEQYLIRRALKNDIDKCVIFIGWKNWYYKFNGILNKTFSDAGDSHISLTGTLFNEKLYLGKQHSFKNKTLQMIFTELCTSTSMGLYINSPLTKLIDYSLMTGTRYIDYFDFLIKNYTDNLYSVDAHYHFHLANIDKIRNNPIDKYTLNWKSGESMPPQDIIFKSVLKDGTPEKESYEIPIDFFTTDTNFSDVHTKTYNKYIIGYGGNGIENIDSNEKLGIGSNQTNTFFEFKKHKFPFYNDIINKQLAGNIIKIFTQNVCFELTPFSVVGLELYLPFTSGDTVIKRDDEHSGKKIVIGYEIGFVKKSNDNPGLNVLTQIIELI